MRASLRYDYATGMMHVLRSSGAAVDTKMVAVDALRRIGDADVDTFILEAMQYPGQTIQMPLFNRAAHRRAA